MSAIEHAYTPPRVGEIVPFERKNLEKALSEAALKERTKKEAASMERIKTCLDDAVKAVQQEGNLSTAAVPLEQAAELMGAAIKEHPDDPGLRAKAAISLEALVETGTLDRSTSTLVENIAAGHVRAAWGALESLDEAPKTLVIATALEHPEMLNDVRDQLHDPVTPELALAEAIVEARLAA